MCGHCDQRDQLAEHVSTGKCLPFTAGAPGSFTIDNSRQPQPFPLPFIPQILSTQLSVFPQAHSTPAHFYGIYPFILTPYTFIRTDFSIRKTQSLLIMTLLGVWVSGEPIFHDLSQAVRDWSVNIEQKVHKHNRERETRDETTVGT